MAQGAWKMIKTQAQGAWRRAHGKARNIIFTLRPVPCAFKQGGIFWINSH
jgi:hypothetical protein